MNSVHSIGSRLSQLVFALACIDALLGMLAGRSLLDAFAESRIAIQQAIATLTFMAAGFCLMIGKRRLGALLFAATLYMFFRDAVTSVLSRDVLRR